jgi:hypothetical protein
MKAVSRFEANLLRILHFFLGRVPREQALPLLVNAQLPPRCLSADAIALVEDSLAKGCTLLLARSGGWRRERHLRAGRVAEGRLWERTPPAELGLSFSARSLDFLIGLTTVKLPEAEPWNVPVAELTVADMLLFFFAHEALREVENCQPLRETSGLAQNALCRLAYPEDFPPSLPAPDFAPWTSELGACILEALQPMLAQRWLGAERGKAQLLDWRRLAAVGRSQEAVLVAFLIAVENAGRLDLARFLLRTLGRLLTPDASAAMWGVRIVRGGPRMADRLETTQAALALLRQTERFQGWERRARSVGYFDEEYEGSQLTKNDWERCGGDDLFVRAQAIIRATDPLRVTTEGQT